MHRRSFLAGACIAAASLAGCVGDLETATETLPLDALTAQAVLSVDNRNGDVAVRTAEREAGELSLTKRTRRGVDLSRVSVAVETAGPRVRLAPDIPADVDPGHVSLDVEVAAPQGVEVDRVETSNGRVLLEGCTGEPSLVSSNGDVTARGVGGYVFLETANGSVTARDVTGIDHLATSNGNVTAEIPAIRRDVTVRTSNGTVEAELGPDLNARLDAGVSNGTVLTRNLDLADADVSDKRVRGTLGSGDHRLTVRTTNGAIDLSGMA